MPESGLRRLRIERTWPVDVPAYSILEVMFPDELRSRLWFTNEVRGFYDARR